MIDGQAALGSRRLLASAGLAAIGSWVGLAITLGNVGLQQLASGQVDRAVANPLAFVVTFVVAAAAVWLVGPPSSARFALLLLLLLLVADVGGALLAVALVGELEVQHLGRIVLALAGFGTQLLGAAAGLVARSATRARRA